MQFTNACATAILFALAAAAPAKTPKQEQRLLFTVPGDEGKPTYVSVNAVSNGTIGNLVLKAGRLSVYPGTPIHFTGRAKDLHLHFDVDGEQKGVYGAHVVPVGDSYGYTEDVTAIFHHQEGGWMVDEKSGQVSHKLTAALQSFFACADHVGEENNTFLKWGVYQANGQPPVGCTTTEVVRVVS